MPPRLRPRPRVSVPLLALIVVAGAIAPITPARAAATPHPESETLSAALVAHINQDRVQSGLPPLRLAADVSEVAAERAVDMATAGYFAHVSPTGVTPFDLLEQYGVPFRVAAENIAKGDHPMPELIERIHRAFMASDGHRANNLSVAYGRVGIGVATDGRMTFIAVVFAD
jgi:uncharacterized protein YkwD